MDQLLIDVRGREQSGLIRLLIIVFGGFLIVGSVISIIVWSTNVSSINSLVQNTIEQTKKELNSLNTDFTLLPEPVKFDPKRMVIFKNGDLTFEGAVDACHKLDGSLITLPKNEDYIEFRNYAIETDLGRVWVGAIYKHESMKWQWITGEDMDMTKPPWAARQPQHNDEFCVALDKDYKFHDYPCSSRQSYVCYI